MEDLNLKEEIKSEEAMPSPHAGSIEGAQPFIEENAVLAAIEESRAAVYGIRHYSNQRRAHIHGLVRHPGDY
jgi:hypothetical protein